VLHWAARGKSNAEIGQILGCEGNTVKNHLRVICQIYGTPNRVCAVMRAMARGDVSASDVLREFA
jgi:DNA-binding CsgD family transcriptional regulator